MKYTHKEITELLINYGKLQEKVAAFVNKGYDPKKYSWSRARINHESFSIEREENTACNCHPEYEWVEFATLDQFVEWCEKEELTEKSMKA